MVAVWGSSRLVTGPNLAVFLVFFFGCDFLTREFPPCFLLDRSLQRRSRRELATNEREAARSGKEGETVLAARDSCGIGTVSAGLVRMRAEKKVGRRDLEFWFVTLLCVGKLQAFCKFQVPAGPRGGLWLVRAKPRVYFFLGAPPWFTGQLSMRCSQYGLVSFLIVKPCHTCFSDPCSTHHLFFLQPCSLQATVQSPTSFPVACWLSRHPVSRHRYLV